MFQKVFDLIQDNIPADWDKLAFFAIYFDGGYTMKYYVKTEGKYLDCYNIAKEEKVEKTFSDIDKVIEPIRYKLSDKDKWKVFTMTVTSDGNMKSEFEYDDVSGNEIDYIRNWKKKYLK